MARKHQTDRPQLSRLRVLEAALALVERDGLAALSMRKLAAELAIEAMTLYYYFPNKDAILDGLLEHVMMDMQIGPFNEQSTWSDWLRAGAIAYRSVMLRYPRLVPLMATRTLQTPDSLTLVEQLAAALCQVGFQPLQAIQALNIVNTFVIGHMLAEVGSPGDHEVTNPDAASLIGMIDPLSLPTISAALQAGLGQEHEQQARFELGLEALLTGFQSWITA